MGKIKRAVILAGGKGTRLSEQTKFTPKPLVKVNGKPIMERIMEHLASEGITEFYILGGYLIECIYEYFYNDRIDDESTVCAKNMLSIISKNKNLNGARINIIDTGLNSGTAERIYKVKDLLKDEPFLMTYGDTYSDVDISKIEEQLSGNRILSLCAVPYIERFGLVKIKNDNEVEEFKEKSESKIYFVNGGFICMKPEFLDYIKPEHFDLSKETLEQEELKGKIGAYVYRGYWKAVDTQRDLDEINKDFKDGRVE